jgi:hypothetical protein
MYTFLLQYLAIHGLEYTATRLNSELDDAILTEIQEHIDMGDFEAAQAYAEKSKHQQTFELLNNRIRTAVGANGVEDIDSFEVTATPDDQLHQQFQAAHEELMRSESTD